MGFKDAAVIERTTQEHGALLDALLARRADEAKTAMAAHLEEAKRQVLSNLCAPREAVKARNPARTVGPLLKYRKTQPRKGKTP
jgi:hypothetical protein